MVDEEEKGVEDEQEEEEKGMVALLAFGAGACLGAESIDFTDWRDCPHEVPGTRAWVCECVCVCARVCVRM